MNCLKFEVFLFLGKIIDNGHWATGKDEHAAIEILRCHSKFSSIIKTHSLTILNKTKNTLSLHHSSWISQQKKKNWDRGSKKLPRIKVGYGKKLKIAMKSLKEKT